MDCDTNSVALKNTCPTWFQRHSIILLFVILLLAAVLRFVNLEQSPPGLNQDEAISAWPAYCLLKTGKDNVGQSWPIYYMRGLGGNNPTLFTYLTIPFQAIGGLNIYTTRLPAAFGGVFTVWLIYWVAKKLFDTETGLAAAALLAMTPWHLLQSRWGHEVSITPLLGLIPLAGMLWANLPVGNNKNDTPRPVIAGISGILAGIGCFGYQAVRLFVPVCIFAIILFNLPLWWKTVKTKKGALAVALFIIGFTSIFGQLLYLHIFHPEGIGKHANFQSGWVGNVGLIDTRKTVSTDIEMFRKLLDSAQCGDNVGVLLRGTKKEDVERGMVLAKPGSITPHMHFKAEVYVLSKEEGGRHTPFFTNYRPQFYFRTTDVTGTVTLPQGVEMVMPGDNVSVEVKVIAPVAMEKGQRFAIREGGRTIGAGRVTEVIA